MCPPAPLTCSKLHVHQLSVSNDGDAALRHGVHHKLAVQVLVAAVTAAAAAAAAAAAWQDAWGTRQGGARPHTSGCKPVFAAPLTPTPSKEGPCPEASMRKLVPYHAVYPACCVLVPCHWSRLCCVSPLPPPLPPLPCVVWVHCHCCVAQHGLRARGGHHNLTAAVLQGVGKAGQHTKLNRLRQGDRQTDRHRSTARCRAGEGGSRAAGVSHAAGLEKAVF